MLRTVIIICTVALLIGGFYFWMIKSKPYRSDPATLAMGKELFATHCLSCHGMQQEGIGPPLGGVTRILPASDLKTFIRDPAKVIAGGDSRVKSLATRYKLTMPGYDWMEPQSLDAILSYIDHESERHGLQGMKLPTGARTDNLSGKIVKPVAKSDIKIHLDEMIQIPRLAYSTPDLGIVTLRPHPSGDGSLFVSDQGGIIYIVQQGKAHIFMDLRQHIKDFSIGPGLATGLGSFDFHPDYLRNGKIYITHAEHFAGQQADYSTSDSAKAEVQWVLGEWVMHSMADQTFEGSYRELLRLHAPTFGHGAQDLAFIPGLPEDHPDYGLLYWGFGDGGSNNIRKPELGHHNRSFLGSILRIDPAGNNSRNGKYGIPHDNPFVGSNDPETVKEIYAYGFRNPHRLAWDASNNNRMLATDIGEANIEEINIVENGGDYGWPNREGIFGITTTKDLKTVYRIPPSDAGLYKGPFAQYDHTEGYAISGGYVYQGEIGSLRNKYIFGDIVNGRLFYINITHDMTDSTIYEVSVVHQGKLTDLRTMTGLKRLHLRIAYDGFSKQLYIITKADGKIYRVVEASQ